ERRRLRTSSRPTPPICRDPMRSRPAGSPRSPECGRPNATAQTSCDMASEIVAVDGGTAVVRVEVRYGNPVHQEYRDLWVIRFAADGRCAVFEEWPFWPGQP